ncbi:MAG: glutamate 5-kinase [Desulfuromonadales bacterium]|nr:glutamate 5-kinase [Desulfuromonadales bacterium]
MNIPSMRENLLAHVRQVVIKIGSGVISTSNGLEDRQVDAIAGQVAALRQRGYKVVLVSSGAIAAGKGDLGITGRPATIPLQQAAAAIGQSRMMQAYRDAFAKRGVKVAQILLTRDDLANRRRYLNARNTLMTLLEHDILPIVNENDTVVVEEIRCGDNDNLSAMVTNLVEADMLTIMSDVDGLYDSDPRSTPGARLIPLVEKVTAKIEGCAGGSVTQHGTGGMETKVKAAKRAALNGVGTAIVNGRREQILDRLFSGEEVGTYFLPAGNPMATRKHWLAFTTKPRGKLHLDRGACTALVERGKSLLPSGVARIEGSFDRGDAVRLIDPDGVEFAKGVINYALPEMLKIIGKKSTEIEAVLGYKYGDEVIHRDNMVLKDRSEE